MSLMVGARTPGSGFHAPTMSYCSRKSPTSAMKQELTDHPRVRGSDSGVLTSPISAVYRFTIFATGKVRSMIHSAKPRSNRCYCYPQRRSMKSPLISEWACRCVLGFISYSRPFDVSASKQGYYSKGARHQLCVSSGR